MRVLRNVLIALCCLLLAAHFSRAGADLLVVVWLALPLLLLPRRPLPVWTLRIALLLGGVEWLRTTVLLTTRRIDAGESWLRMAVILGAVAGVTFVAAWMVRVPSTGAGPGSETG